MINHQLIADHVANNYVLNFIGCPTTEDIQQMNFSQEFEDVSLPECLTPPSSVNNLDNPRYHQMFTHIYDGYQQTTNSSYGSINSTGQLSVEQNVSRKINRKIRRDEDTLNDSDNYQNIQHLTNAVTPHVIISPSAVEEDDLDVKPFEEPLGLLQSIDSGNLMQLSQQSSVQRTLVGEHINNKPKINLPPSLEEHEGDYKFRISVQSKGPQIRGNKSNAVYSEHLKKLYIKKNENVYIDAYYTLKIPIQPLRARAFMVFSKDTSEPVLRCQNHICEDNNENIKIRHSMLRCENAGVEYCGSETGKYIKDRYSVVIPLDAYVKSAEGENQVKQQLLFNFSCNNSCMGRRETSAIFLLETMSGEILAQRVLHVKVCTSPRRDKRSEEMPPKMNRKRKAPYEYCTETKTLKLDNSSLNTDYSRSSCEEISEYGISDGSGGKCPNHSLHRENNGDFVMTLRFKNREATLNAIKLLFVDVQMREFFYHIPKERDEFWHLYQEALAAN
ncbi:p53 isoform 1-T1 [Glossina fuscipes fuscipes]